MRGKSGPGLLCAAMLLLVPDQACAEGSARPNNEIQRTPWTPRQRAAEILGIAAGLSTLAGFCGIIWRDGAVPYYLPDGAEKFPGTVRMRAVATHLAVWGFVEGATLAGAAIPLALAKPSLRGPHVAVRLRVGGIWLASVW